MCSLLKRYPLQTHPFSIYSYKGDEKINHRIINRYIKKGQLNNDVVVINPFAKTVSVEHSLYSNSLEEIIIFIKSKKYSSCKPLIIINKTESIENGSFFCDLQKNIINLNNLAFNGAQIVFFGSKKIDLDNFPIFSALSLCISDEIFDTSANETVENNLSVVSGPMFADKSTLLIQDYFDIKELLSERESQECNEICVAKAKKANRENNIVDRHGNEIIPDIRPDTFAELVDYLKNNPSIKNIIVDEVQFVDFHDPLTPYLQNSIIQNLWHLLHVIGEGKSLYFYGLDQSYYNLAFLSTAVASEFGINHKLKAVCNGCGGPATNTYNLNHKKMKTLDTDANYIALCKKCNCLTKIEKISHRITDPLLVTSKN